ncbi:uncharacterized protein LOC131536112 isoform X1 [Onychostoma macrolepis]|uniref:uncharacterized protein LOC131536112 isoform X1 n=1 Tax=Onychostoma macrolepis TaxID=369639 RepID=UPI00272D80EC|nr:uncharacterized protein LOC131536112 isoform X1 [Onychostoma macrolepis]
MTSRKCPHKWLVQQESCSYIDRGRRRSKVLHLNAIMYNITVSCAEINTPAGFVYVILPVLLNQTDNPDCDQSWYLQDKRLIADPSDPQKLIAPVISVSSDRLVTSHCVNELHHEIICHSDGLKHETMFRAFNDSVSGSTQSPESHQWWWISVLIFIVLLVFICFLLRKRIFRCFPSVFQRSDSEIRDPESGVQMQLRSDESDSLNQSESEQINGSVSRG